MPKGADQEDHSHCDDVARLGVIDANFAGAAIGVIDTLINGLLRHLVPDPKGTRSRHRPRSPQRARPGGADMSGENASNALCAPAAVLDGATAIRP